MCDFSKKSNKHALVGWMSDLHSLKTILAWTWDAFACFEMWNKIDVIVFMFGRQSAIQQSAIQYWKKRAIKFLWHERTSKFRINKNDITSSAWPSRNRLMGNIENILSMNSMTMPERMDVKKVRRIFLFISPWLVSRRSNLCVCCLNMNTRTRRLTRHTTNSSRVVAHIDTHFTKKLCVSIAESGSDDDDEIELRFIVYSCVHSGFWYIQAQYMGERGNWAHDTSSPYLRSQGSNSVWHAHIFSVFFFFSLQLLGLSVCLFCALLPRSKINDNRRQSSTLRDTQEIEFCGDCAAVDMQIKLPIFSLCSIQQQREELQWNFHIHRGITHNRV